MLDACTGPLLHATEPESLPRVTHAVHAMVPRCAVQYSVDDQLDSMLPLYRRINKDAPHLRTLIYTGTPAAELI